MNSGSNTLVNKMAEVTNISPFGFWMLVNKKEYFISYEDFPVYQTASILDIASVSVDAFGNLHWPSLDADIELESLENPDAYPLHFKE